MYSEVFCTVHPIKKKLHNNKLSLSLLSLFIFHKSNHTYVSWAFGNGHIAGTP